MPVNRCVCHDVTFETLKRLAVAERLDFGGLQRRSGCGLGCGMCEPYVRRMLETGRTSFEPLADSGKEPTPADSATR